MFQEEMGPFDSAAVSRFNLDHEEESSKRRS
jgi:hypothetical protein